MRSTKILFSTVIFVLFAAESLLAVPTFQVYIEGATAGDFGPDQQSWLTTDSTFNLVAVGAYGPKTVSLTEVTLALSVPQGQTGTISITGGDIGANLLTTKTQVVGTEYFNPNADADTPVLADMMGNTGYDEKNFLPSNLNVNFNNHYPFQTGVSDFVIYGIGEFDKIANAVSNYSTEEGIDYNIADGEEKIFTVSVEGFNWVHFDLYGYETSSIDGVRQLKATWDISPGSHDATYIPAPGAVLLAGIGLGLVSWLRRHGSF